MKPFTFVFLFEYIGGRIVKIKKIFVKVKNFFIVKFYPDCGDDAERVILKSGGLRVESGVGKAFGFYGVESF